MSGMRAAIAQLVMVLLAFWPVWIWYGARTTDGSDEPLGVVALLTLVLLILMRRQGREAPRGLCPAVLFLLIAYCALCSFAPKTILAALGVCALALSLRNLGLTGRLYCGDWLLVMLSLPVVASMNFYAGYPLRVLSSHLAVIFLNLGALGVTRSGAQIFLDNCLVSIDQPCSGIKTLWTAVFLAALLAALKRLSPADAARVTLFAVFSSIIANALRVSSLVYLETGAINVPPSLHDPVHTGVGVASFALFVVLIVLYARSMQEASAENRAERERVLSGRLAAVMSSLLILCFAMSSSLAAVLPVMGPKETAAAPLVFPGFPSTFEGRELRAVPLSSLTSKFVESFPGRIGVFSDGRRRIVIRFVYSSTRQLHPSSHCYRAGGYEIKWLPELFDSAGIEWGRFRARRGRESLVVRERIYDSGGGSRKQSFTDVSAWYWSALMGRSRGPWWAITVVEPLPSQLERHGSDP
ncbi:MAG: archaeosortase/exosortase family protein [Cyanobacteria bacterium HKST-UBA02]|nr:archaeosortase/exosortase family protein [Cyanobacteria bacterium HKST-UBA02]